MNLTQPKEKILVIPSNLIQKIGYFQNICFKPEVFLDAISRNAQFIDRASVESDFNFKQIIPYALLYHNNKILSYIRGPNSIESRLEGKCSIGIGGHIKECDVEPKNNIWESCIEREINEELIIETQYENKICAVLNDDTDDVGRVHFGIIILIALEFPQIKKREESLVQCCFSTIDELIKNIEKYENWSKICIQNIHILLR